MWHPPTEYKLISLHCEIPQVINTGTLSAIHQAIHQALQCPFISSLPESLDKCNSKGLAQVPRLLRIPVWTGQVLRPLEFLCDLFSLQPTLQDTLSSGTGHLSPHVRPPSTVPEAASCWSAFVCAQFLRFTGILVPDSRPSLQKDGISRWTFQSSSSFHESRNK